MYSFFAHIYPYIIFACSVNNIFFLDKYHRSTCCLLKKWSHENIVVHVFSLTQINDIGSLK